MTMVREDNTRTKRQQIYNVASFFGGVGGIDLGLEQTGFFHSVYINEFDRNALQTLRINFPRAHIDSRDIRTVHACDVPMVDVMVGGFPCQAFSIAGYRKGFDDTRGDLFFEMLRIIRLRKPRAILLENVKNLITHNNGITFNTIRDSLAQNGYYIKWKVMNAKDYGNIPQNRERLYIVGFNNWADFKAYRFPDKIKLTVELTKIINYKNKQGEEYYYRPSRQPFYDKLLKGIKDQNTVYQWRRQYVRQNKSGVVPTLTANMGTGGHNVPLILTDYGIRKLTPRETFNAMGFPPDFNLPNIAQSQLYKQAGNSVVVPVIKRIADNMAQAMNQPYVVNQPNNEKIVCYRTGNAHEGECYDSSLTPSRATARKYVNLLQQNNERLPGVCW